jgi:hypothetical protein
MQTLAGLTLLVAFGLAAVTSLMAVVLWAGRRVARILGGK